MWFMAGFGVRTMSDEDATPLLRSPTTKLDCRTQAAAPKNGAGAPKESGSRFSVEPENGEASNVLDAPKLSSSPIKGQRRGWLC